MNVVGIRTYSHAGFIFLLSLEYADAVLVEIRRGKFVERVVPHAIFSIPRAVNPQPIYSEELFSSDSPHEAHPAQSFVTTSTRCCAHKNARCARLRFICVGGWSDRGWMCKLCRQENNRFVCV